MSNADEASRKTSTDMLPLLRDRTDYQQLSEELFQCCDHDDILTEKCRKDCVN